MERRLLQRRHHHETPVSLQHQFLTGPHDPYHCDLVFYTVAKHAGLPVRLEFSIKGQGVAGATQSEVSYFTHDQHAALRLEGLKERMFRSSVDSLLHNIDTGFEPEWFTHVLNGGLQLDRSVPTDLSHSGLVAFYDRHMDMPSGFDLETYQALTQAYIELLGEGVRALNPEGLVHLMEQEIRRVLSQKHVHTRKH